MKERVPIIITKALDALNRKNEMFLKEHGQVCTYDMYLFHLLIIKICYGRRLCLVHDNDLIAPLFFFHFQSVADEVKNLVGRFSKLCYEVKTMEAVNLR
jgi:hypothetical protein